MSTNLLTDVQTTTPKDNVTLLSDHRNQQIFSSQINYFEQGMPERGRLENFISGVYKKYYKTEIDQFYPNLLAIESHSDANESSIKAVAGIRSAEYEALFSEYYLPDSLEETLFNVYETPISRETVVEVGNLAPANIGQMRWLITSIAAFLYSAGFKYIVFTGVPGISNAFKRMDLPLEVLAEARRSCLPEAIKNKWGSEYYKNKPMVFSGDIEQIYNIVKNIIYSPEQKNQKKLIPLFEKACQLGFQAKKNNDIRHEIVLGTNLGAKENFS